MSVSNKPAGPPLLCVIAAVAVVCVTVGSPAAAAPRGQVAAARLVGQWRGAANDIVSDGRHAFVARGLRVVVYDLSNPEQPAEVGESAPLADLIQALALDGSRVYAALRFDGLAVVDVGDPTKPSVLAVRGPGDRGPSEFVDLAVGGGFAYLADSNGGALWSVAVGALPAAIGSMSRLTVPNARPEALALVGSRLVMAVRPENGPGPSLRVLDVSRPGSPRFAGSVALEGSVVQGLAAAGDTAWVATDRGLAAVSISDPAAPRVVGWRPSPGNTLLGVVGTVAMVAADRSPLELLDVRNPSGPYPVLGKLDKAPAAGTALAAGDGVVFLVSAADGTLWTAGITDLAQPHVLGVVEGPGTILAADVDGAWLFALDQRARVWVLRLDEHGLPAVASRFDLPTRLGSPYIAGWSGAAVSVGGEHIYVSTIDAVSVLAFMPDQTLALMSTWSPPGGEYVTGLAASRDIAVVTTEASFESPRTLHFLDVRDPIHIREVRSQPGDLAAGRPFGGGYVLMPSGNSVVAYDIGDPPRIVPMGRLALGSGSGVRTIEMGAGVAYVTAALGGLFVLDVAQPADMRVVGRLPNVDADSLAALGGFLFAPTWAAIGLADVRNPAQPEWLGEVSAPSFQPNLVAGEHCVYGLAGAAGLLIYGIAGDPTAPQCGDGGPEPPTATPTAAKRPWHAYLPALHSAAATNAAAR